MSDKDRAEQVAQAESIADKWIGLAYEDIRTALLWCAIDGIDSQQRQIDELKADIDSEGVVADTAQAIINELQAQLTEARKLLQRLLLTFKSISNGRVGHCGDSRIYTPQLDVAQVKRFIADIEKSLNTGKGTDKGSEDG